MDDGNNGNGMGGESGNGENEGSNGTGEATTDGMNPNTT